jgi:hypothetical protein
VTLLCVGLYVVMRQNDVALLAATLLPVTPGAMLVTQEGAHGTHLLAHEICEPVLMFGEGGWLDLGSLPIR